MPGIGTGRCRSCLNRAALSREVALQELTLTRADTREWLAAFATWLHARAPNDAALLHDFARHVPFIARLDTMLDETPRCTAEWLLANIPTSELRAHLQFTKFLQEHVGLVLTQEAKAEAAERGRVEQLLRDARASGFGPIIFAFADTLAERGKSLRTQRQYLSTASAFCTFASVTGPTWTPNAVAGFLDPRPGQRGNLGVFLSFCKNDLGWNVDGVPAKTRKAASNARSVVRFREALARVEQAGDLASERDLAVVLEQAFALRRGALAQARLLTSSGKALLQVGGASLYVPRGLAKATHHWWSLVARRRRGEIDT